MSHMDDKKKGIAKKMKPKEVDMTGFFSRMAKEGHNPFKTVTHIGRKKIK